MGQMFVLTFQRRIVSEPSAGAVEGLIGESPSWKGRRP